LRSHGKISRHRKIKSKTKTRRLALERLESRLVLNGLPLLHSHPSAPVAVYLDFDGGTWHGEKGPYDTDGDSATFSASEAADITNAWTEIASYFSMFDVDVTTEQPNTAIQPTAWTLISNDMSGGAASFGFPSQGPTGANNSGDARNRTSGIAHEQGHVFHISHQAEFDLLGNLTRTYRTAQDNVGSIMGVDYAGKFAQWWLGHPPGSPSTIHDDIAIIIGQILANVPGSYTGDGFHPDDFGGDLGTPTSGDTLLTPTGGVWTTPGTIERMTDVDTFSFDWTGGHVAVESRAREGITNSQEVISSVGMDLYIFDSAGTLVGYDDVQTQDDHVVGLTMNLPADRYYVVVDSHGDYADLGDYDVTINGVASAGLDAPISGTDAVAGLVSVHSSSNYWSNIVLQLDNDDPTSTSVTVDRSTDGVHWSQVHTQAGYQASQIFTDTTIAPGETYFYRYGILGGSGGDRYSNRVIVQSSPQAVYDLTITPWQPDQMILNWRDVSGDTGYVIEQSTDGISYSVIATVPTNSNSYTPTGLTLETTYYYRVTTLGGDHGSDNAATVVSGTTPSDNVAPVAVDDTASTIEGYSVVIDVLANDSDPDSDPLSIDSFTQPANGTVVDNGDDTLTYTPDPGYLGSDPFDYTVSDGRGGLATATVTVDVLVPSQFTWQGGNDVWTAANWHDGTTAGQQPANNGEMIIRVPDSLVQVEQDFVSGSTGPAHSVNVGTNYIDGPTAAAGTAEAYYNSVTGELFFDVGANVGVIGIQTAGLINTGAVDDYLGTSAGQNDGSILAYLDFAGLPVGEDSVGLVLPPGLSAADIQFSYTPVGSSSVQANVLMIGVLDGPSSAADTAEALYDPSTGELFFDVGANVGVIGIGTAGLINTGAVEDYLGTTASQNDGSILAYLDFAGLPVGEDSVGLVLPPGLSAGDIQFSYTPNGGPSVQTNVTIIGSTWPDGSVATLEVDATLEVNSDVSIGLHGILSGTGTVQVGNQIQVKDGGTVAPGNSIGALTVLGDVTLANGSTLAVELSGSGSPTAGVNNDLLVANDLTLVGSPALQLDWIPGEVGNGMFGGIYTIATYSGTLVGDFANPTLSAVYDGTDASAYIDTTYGTGGIDYGSGTNDVITVKLKDLLVGDANLDGDVDVFQPDGNGDAQILSSYLGASFLDGPTAAPGTAEAIYNPLTGELFFDVGANVGVIGIGTAGLINTGAVDDYLGTAPGQNDGSILAFFDFAGLPVGEDSVGFVLPTGLSAEDILFSYTPTGGASVQTSIKLAIRVWGNGDFNLDGDVDVFQFDGNGDAQLLSSNLGTSLDVGASAATGIAEGPVFSAIASQEQASSAPLAVDSGMTSVIRNESKSRIDLGEKALRRESKVQPSEVDLLFSDFAHTAERHHGKDRETVLTLPMLDTEPVDDIWQGLWDDALLDVLEPDDLGWLA
jgi:hypothetical protein